MGTIRTLITARRGSAGVVLRAAIVAGYGILVCGCQTVQQETAGLPSAPFDYRQRHPITVTEAEHTLQIFIGANRASLTPMQRADVLAFGQTWKTDATGGVLIDLPAGTVNEQASVGAMHEIQSILAASGVPPASMMVRTYQAGPRSFATVRITYPKITAQAGPCGLWPKDIGPSATAAHFENQQDWNFGCSAQHNLAVMVANPEDLVQPRGETPAYTARRTKVVDDYRKGNSTATQYPVSGGRISNFGQ